MTRKVTICSLAIVWLLFVLFHQIQYGTRMCKIDVLPFGRTAANDTADVVRNVSAAKAEGFETVFDNGVAIFRESRLAHELLDGLRGIEIGPSEHNPYGLDTLNVDYTDNATVFKHHQALLRHTKPVKIHLVSPGNRLPFTDDSVDFVLSSHVLEHFWDPINAVEEWLRVTKPRGYVYMDIPHKERTFDRARNRTTLAELLDRRGRPMPNGTDPYGHHSVWITEDLLELSAHQGWTVHAWRDEDDKTSVHGNKPIGFTIVLKKCLGALLMAIFGVHYCCLRTQTFTPTTVQPPEQQNTQSTEPVPTTTATSTTTTTTTSVPQCCVCCGTSVNIGFCSAFRSGCPVEITVQVGQCVPCTAAQTCSTGGGGPPLTRPVCR